MTTQNNEAHLVASPATEHHNDDDDMVAKAAFRWARRRRVCWLDFGGTIGALVVWRDGRVVSGEEEVEVVKKRRCA
jgi:hypothetical protein